MKTLRIIIAGGRDFDDYSLLRTKVIYAVKDVLIKVNQKNLIPKQQVTIISGTAKGADSLGEQFAKEFELALKQMPAQWDAYGKSAGYRRNVQMAEFAREDDNAQGILIAFWDGKSRGTKHMIEIAQKHDLMIYVFNYNGDEIQI